MAFATFGQRSGHSAPMSEINTTPLVDVMLVLLVVFLITAPVLQQAVTIDLPKASAAALADKPQVIRLALDGTGRLFWNGQPLARPALAARLQAAAASQPQLQLHADQATRYEVLAGVMAAAQHAGIVNIAFVTQPPAP